MINITRDEIQHAGGLLSALSIKSAEYIATFLKGKKIVLPPNISELKRIITHSNAHLDEYFAILLFRACLPPHLRKIPVEETIINSHTNDVVAKTTWPEAAVFGIGATVTGGAKPLLIFDEHVPHGKYKKNLSCSDLTLKKLIKNNIMLPLPLNKVLGEVHHIDANGQAHYKQLNNICKWFWDREFIFHMGKSSLEIQKDTLRDDWKQAIIEATIAAAVYSNSNYDKKTQVSWKETAKESLSHYEQHTLLKNQEYFKKSIKTLRGRILNFQGAELKSKLPDGSHEIVKDANGNPVKQKLVLPYLTLACLNCWGPILGQIILSHFWESRILMQMSFEKITHVLNSIIIQGKEKISMPSPIGKIEFQILNDISIKVTETNPKTKESRTKTVSPWIIQLTPSPGIEAAKGPLTGFLNTQNSAVGITSIKSQYGTLVLSRGNNLPYEVWKDLADTLINIEGDANDPQSPGCWHITINESNTYESFLLNGNKSHQYVPRTSLDFRNLVQLVRKVWR
jgi:hypothetical protein